MKNLKIMALFVIAFLAFPFFANAATLDKDDLPNNTYVIGSFVFTSSREPLTTQQIMWAAYNMPGSLSIDDMIVYYKNDSGAWVNGLNQSDTSIDYTPSDSITATHINLTDFTDPTSIPEVTNVELDENGMVTWDLPDDESMLLRYELTLYDANGTLIDEAKTYQ